MLLDIKMCRFENVPWGFRLVGGADFEYPLTVVKVTEDSIAEEAGLRLDDVIVRINDTAATPLTHDEANRIIKSCGNVFYFGVYRESDDDFEDEPQKFPVFEEEPKVPTIEVERVARPDSLHEEMSSICKSPTSEIQSEDFHNDYLPELPDRPCSALSDTSETKFVEEEIAAVLSGESEVLKEHNVLGIFPKPGVCMTSDVLRSLNEEMIKTKAEKDKENKKWSTFLQKPNRPIPISKQQIEAERRAANAYKVKLVRSAPKEKRAVSPMPVHKQEPPKEPTPPKIPTPPPSIEPEVVAEEQVEEEPLPTDSEVPNLETVSADGNDVAEEQENNSNGDEKIDKEKEIPNENEANVDQTNNEIECNNGADEQAVNEPARESLTSSSSPSSTSITAEKRLKTEEELALEKQLADVQKQLAALSTLPSTIQSTLDAVTKQLAEMLPTFKLQQQIIKPPQNGIAETREISLEKIDEDATAEEESRKECDDSRAEVSNKDNVSAVSSAATAAANGDMEKSVSTIDDNENKENENLAKHEKRDANDMEMESIELARKNAVNVEKSVDEIEAQQMRKQKKHDVIEELEQHLERKNKPRRSKRAFGPLTPSAERPLVLPGGRRWYKPKDAYNDEFIAETLSAQAELITGTTLGVNFMKYQKPEKKIDLNRSEVYKVIHHLDRQPVRGIEVRPPVVPAEIDIREAVHS